MLTTTEIILIILLAITILSIIVLVLILVLKPKQSINTNTNETDLKEKEEQKLNQIREQEALKTELALLIERSTQKNKDELYAFREGILKSIDENIVKMNDKVEDKLNKGFISTNETFIKITEQLTRIDAAQAQIEKLSQNVVSLGDILSDKKARGTFGEVQLYHILQNVFGDNKNIYETQKKLDNGFIVDAILYGPEPMGSVAIDSKFPLENYRKLIDKTISDHERTQADKLFKQDVKKHIDDIANKYIIGGQTSNQAIMFIPAEAVFAEIHANHEDLISYAQSKHIWFSSPTTLIYMLTTVQVILRNIEQDKNAQTIRVELAKLSDEFNRFFERWDKLKSNMQTIQKNVGLVDITAGKIGRKFEQISDVDLEQLDIEED